MGAANASSIAATAKAAAYDRAAYYVAQLAGWGFYALFIYLFSPGSRGTVAAANALLWSGTGLFGTHILRTYVNRHPEQTLSRLALKFAAAIILVPALMVSVQLLAFGMASQPGIHSPGVVAHFFQAMLVVSLWCALYFSAHEFRRRRAAETEALRLALVAQVAQFRTLRSQLNPHFLFNCLNSLRELMDEDRDRAQQLVTRLSELLRYTLRADSVETVSLKEELAAAQDYLALERIRFEERLQLQYEIAPETLTARVPPMLLQTLAENGVKHGIAKLPAGGLVRIATSAVGDSLRIDVTNTGSFTPANGSTAIGLENARERLKLVYGEKAQLTVQMDDDHQVHATVTIPLSKSRQAMS